MFESMQPPQECMSHGAGTRPALHHSHTCRLLPTTAHLHHYHHHPRPGLPRCKTTPHPPRRTLTARRASASVAAGTADNAMPAHTHTYTDTTARHAQQPQSPRKYATHASSGDAAGETQRGGMDSHEQQTGADADAMDTADDASLSGTMDSGSPLYAPTPVRADKYLAGTHDQVMGPPDDQQMGCTSAAKAAAADSASRSPPPSPTSRARAPYMTRENTRSPPYAAPSVFASSSMPPSSYKADWLRTGGGVPYTPYPPSSASCLSASSSNTDASAESAYVPCPAPPTVLTPPPPEERADRVRAPHEPFLSHAAPPRGTDIRVETSTREYRLIIRLPGFRRDSITLSTRRRRILHIVADSWEPGGGHLERRIAFGYDADLTMVRAEFDGELLRVIVPRRVAPMTYMEARFS